MIDGMTVGMGNEVNIGVLVAIVEFVVGFGNDVAVGSDFTTGELEQLAITITSSDKNKFLISLV